MTLQTIDRYGREMYLYSVNYKTFDGRTWSFEFYAATDEDAQNRLDMIKQTRFKPEQVVERQA